MNATPVWNQAAGREQYKPLRGGSWDQKSAWYHEKRSRMKTKRQRSHFITVRLFSFSLLLLNKHTYTKLKAGADSVVTTCVRCLWWISWREFDSHWRVGSFGSLSISSRLSIFATCVNILHLEARCKVNSSRRGPKVVVLVLISKNRPNLWSPKKP